MLRPTITDMQDKDCRNYYDIYLIHSQYKGHHNKRSGVVFGHATVFVDKSCTTNTRVDESGTFEYSLIKTYPTSLFTDNTSIRKSNIFTKTAEKHTTQYKP